MNAASSMARSNALHRTDFMLRLCAAVLAALAASPAVAATPVREDGTWRPIFFEPIDHATATTGLEPLRDKRLGNGETEIRVWEGFGVMPLKGYVLHRGKVSKGWIVEDGKRLLPVTPRVGWEAFWKALESSSVYSLPDSSTLSGGVAVLDGTSYVVEVHRGKRYRTYFYSNPRHQPWPEAKSLLAVVSLLREQLERSLAEAMTTATVTFSPERDAAATYVSERKFFILRFADRCRKELDMPDPDFGDPEGDRWESKHDRFTTAVARYKHKRRANTDPVSDYMVMFDDVGKAQKKAYAEADAALKAAADKTKACRDFFNDSEAGTLDIDSSNPHYKALEGMAQELFDPLPRR